MEMCIPPTVGQRPLLTLGAVTTPFDLSRACPFTLMIRLQTGLTDHHTVYDKHPQARQELLAQKGLGGTHRPFSTLNQVGLCEQAIFVLETRAAAVKSYSTIKHTSEQGPAGA